jgi:hypothetical protein
MIGIVKGHIELENKTNSLTPGAVSQGAHRLLDMSALSYLLRKESRTQNMALQIWCSVSYLGCCPFHDLPGRAAQGTEEVHEIA